MRRPPLLLLLLHLLLGARPELAADAAAQRSPPAASDADAMLAEVSQRGASTAGLPLDRAAPRPSAAPADGPSAPEEAPSPAPAPEPAAPAAPAPAPAAASALPPLLLLLALPAGSGAAEVRLLVRDVFGHAPFAPGQAERRPLHLLLTLGGGDARPLAALESALRAALSEYGQEAEEVASLAVQPLRAAARGPASAREAAENELFYSTLLAAEGTPLRARLERYPLLLRLAPGALALSRGWLGALLRAAVAGGTDWVVAGGSAEGAPCLLPLPEAGREAEAHRGDCRPAAAAAEVDLAHLDGCALYRPGAALRTLLRATRLRHPASPFDQALWLAAEEAEPGADGIPAGALLALPLVQAVPHPLATEAGADAATPLRREQLGDLGAGRAGVQLLLLPPAFRVSPLVEALAQLSASRPVSVLAAAAPLLPLVRQALGALLAAGVGNVLLVALDEVSYAALSEPGARPAAFPLLRNLTLAFDDPGHLAPLGALEAAVQARRQAVICDLLGLNASVFALDASSHARRDYGPLLARLDPGAIHALSDAPGATGLHRFGEAKPRHRFSLAVFYAPAASAPAARRLLLQLAAAAAWEGGEEAAALDAGVRCARAASCAHAGSGARLRLLPPHAFLNGANAFGKQWPNPRAVRQAALLHAGHSESLEARRFRLRSAGAWAAVERCENLTMLPLRAARLGAPAGEAGGGPGGLLARLHGFLRHAAAFDCAVLPPLQVWGTETALPFDAVLSFEAAARLAQPCRLFPAARWLEAAAEPQLYLPQAETQPPADLLLAPQLANQLAWVAGKMGPNRVCVDDLDRPPEQVALLAALRPTDFAAALGAAAAAAAAARPGGLAFLAGPWRVVHALVEAADASVAVSAAHRYFPEHERVTFGLPHLQGRVGDCPLFELLDWALCRGMTARVTLASLPAWPPDEALRQIAQHVPPALLEAGLGALGGMGEEAGRKLFGRRLIFHMQPAAGGPVGALLRATALLRAAQALPGAAAALPPLPAAGGWAPWASAANATALYAPPPPLPPALLPLLLPRLLFDLALFGSKALPLPLRPQRSFDDAPLQRHARVFRQLVAAARARRGGALSILHLRFDVEGAWLMGRLALAPAEPRQGVRYDELAVALQTLPVKADVGLLVAPHAVQWGREAGEWRGRLPPSAPLAAAAARMRAALPPRFACAALRLARHNRSDALERLLGWAEEQRAAGLGAVYLAEAEAAATAEAPPRLARLLAQRSGFRVATCASAGGCEPSERALRPLAELELCSHSEAFDGPPLEPLAQALCEQSETLCPPRRADSE